MGGTARGPGLGSMAWMRSPGSRASASAARLRPAVRACKRGGPGAWFCGWMRSPGNGASASAARRRPAVRASAEGPGLGSMAWMRSPGSRASASAARLRPAVRACKRGGAGQREADVPRRGIACGGTSPVRRGIACGNTSPVLRGIARGNTSPARRSIACGNTSPARRAFRKRLSARARGLGRISQSAPLRVRSSFQNVPSAVDKTVDLRYDMDGFSQSGGSLYVQPYPGGHHEPDAKSHIFGALPSQPNMEAYRSGHNGPDSKSGSPQGLVGSNPTASATKGHRY